MRKGIIREFGMDMYTLLYLKWITKKDLSYSTWNSVQCYVAAWIGEGFGGRMDTFVVGRGPFQGPKPLSEMNYPRRHMC